MGTTNNWVDGRTVLTTTEWNSLSSNPISFKIRAESNEGIWVESMEPAPAACFATSVISEQDHTISITNYYGGHAYVLNNNMTTEELNICTTYIENKYGSNGSNIIHYDAEETAENYCNGTGTISGGTLQSDLTSVAFSSLDNNDINYFLANNIILDTANSSCSTNAIIPSSINGYDVVSIGDNAFLSKRLTGVTLPNTVKTIGSMSFANNQIQNLVIPSSVEELGMGAFAANILSSLTIEDGLRIIGDDAFGMSGLSNVTLPNSITTIGSHAFSFTNITSVTIPSSVISMPCDAFDSGKVEITYENPSFTCSN